MPRVACRSCGHDWEDDAFLVGGYRLWCGECRTRFFVTLDAATPPSDDRDWLEEEPAGCLACGGRLARTGTPPCHRCGGLDHRPADG